MLPIMSNLFSDLNHLGWEDVCIDFKIYTQHYIVSQSVEKAPHHTAANIRFPRETTGAACPQRTVLVGLWAGKVLGEKSLGWKRQSEMISLLISLSHCSNDSLWVESLSSLCGVKSGHSKLCCRNCFTPGVTTCPHSPHAFSLLRACPRVERTWSELSRNIKSVSDSSPKHQICHALLQQTRQFQLEYRFNWENS